MSDNLNPNTDPSKGVKRLNNKPLIIIFAGAALILVVMVSGIMSKGKKRAPQPNEDEDINVASNTEVVDSISNEIPLGTLEVEDPRPEFQPIEKRQNLPKKPIKRAGGYTDEDIANSSIVALSAPPPAKEFNLGNYKQNEEEEPKSIDKLLEQANPVNEFSALRQMLKNDGNNDDIRLKTVDGLVQLDESALAKKRAAENAHIQQTQDGDVVLPYMVQEQVAPLEVKAGSVINVTLVTGINSDLPGRIIAQVNTNVFDSKDGHYLLVPQGTRLLGTYNDDQTYGASRVGVIWDRLIFPNGQSLSVNDMAGVDTEGYAGVADKVNHHYFRIYGSAILLSGVSVGVATANNAEGQETTSDTARNEVAVNLGRVMTKQLEKALDIQPTIEIRPGKKMLVLVTQDLTFDNSYQDDRGLPIAPPRTENQVQNYFTENTKNNYEQRKARTR